MSRVSFDYFLLIGTTCTSFQKDGCTPALKHIVKISARGEESSVKHSFKTVAGISSGPVALDVTSLDRCC